MVCRLWLPSCAWWFHIPMMACRHDGRHGYHHIDMMACQCGIVEAAGFRMHTSITTTSHQHDGRSIVIAITLMRWCSIPWWWCHIVDMVACQCDCHHVDVVACHAHVMICYHMMMCYLEMVTLSFCDINENCFHEKLLNLCGYNGAIDAMLCFHVLIFLIKCWSSKTEINFYFVANDPKFYILRAK